MVHIQLRVVIERRHRRQFATVEIQVVLTGVTPPWREGLLVVFGAVSTVVESQTETRSGQSKRQILVFSQWQPIGAASHCRQS